MPNACNKLPHILQRVRDLEALVRLETKLHSGCEISLKEVFLLEYLRAAYPLSRLEVMLMLGSNANEAKKILEKVLLLEESPFDGPDCDCPACRQRDDLDGE